MWAVKLPIYDSYSRLDNGWITVDEFESQEEAIEFVREEFSANPDGTIQLVYETE